MIRDFESFYVAVSVAVASYFSYWLTLHVYNTNNLPFFLYVFDWNSYELFHSTYGILPLLILALIIGFHFVRKIIIGYLDHRHVMGYVYWLGILLLALVPHSVWMYWLLVFSLLSGAVFVLTWILTIFKRQISSAWRVFTWEEQGSLPWLSIIAFLSSGYYVTASGFFAPISRFFGM